MPAVRKIKPVAGREGIVFLKLLIHCYGVWKRLLKVGRSLYYFRRRDILVHGRVFVGRRGKIRIGERCSVNRGVILQGFNDIQIGKETVLSVNCMVLDGKLDYETLRRTGKRLHTPSFVHIGERVWVGAGAIILPGVTVGPRSVIAAGAIVTQSFPSDVVVAGNPARVVRYLDATERRTKKSA